MYHSRSVQIDSGAARPPQAAAHRFAEGERDAIEADIGEAKAQNFLRAPAARGTALQTYFSVEMTVHLLYCTCTVSWRLMTPP